MTSSSWKYVQTQAPGADPGVHKRNGEGAGGIQQGIDLQPLSAVASLDPKCRELPVRRTCGINARDYLTSRCFGLAFKVGNTHANCFLLCPNASDVLCKIPAI